MDLDLVVVLHRLLYDVSDAPVIDLVLGVNEAVQLEGFLMCEQ